MPEEIIWKGTSSHWKNVNAYTAFILSILIATGLFLQDMGPWGFVLVVLTGIWAFWKWLVNRTTEYQLTTERLVTTRGILTKVTDNLELYRVRDQQVIQPFTLRLLGLHNIHIITTDSSTAEAILDYMPTSLNLGDQLRKHVEACREAKRVRAIDVTSEVPGDHPGDHVGGL